MQHCQFFVLWTWTIRRERERKKERKKELNIISELAKQTRKKKKQKYQLAQWAWPSIITDGTVAPSGLVTDKARQGSSKLYGFFFLKKTLTKKRVINNKYQIKKKEIALLPITKNNVCASEIISATIFAIDAINNWRALIGETKQSLTNAEMILDSDRRRSQRSILRSSLNKNKKSNICCES